MTVAPGRGVNFQPVAGGQISGGVDTQDHQRIPAGDDQNGRCRSWPWDLKTSWHELTKSQLTQLRTSTYEAEDPTTEAVPFAKARPKQTIFASPLSPALRIESSGLTD